MRYLSALSLAACTYTAPIDSGAPTLLNTISGEVVYGGEGAPKNTYVTLFDAIRPPPPIGTGRPLTFAALSGASFSEDVGLPSASFSLTRVQDGRYLVFALMDRDGDFNPFSPSLAGATCGDVGGAHISDLVTGTPSTLEVSDGRLVDGVTVLVGSPYSLERPAFTLRAEPLSLQAIASGSQPPLFRLAASPISAPFSDDLSLSLASGCEPEPTIAGCTEQPACPCAAPLPDCAVSLPIWLVDADADGLTDPYPAAEQAEAGLLDIWPRVYLESVGELGTFPYEDRELPERFVAEAFPLAAEIFTVAATAQIPPNAAAGQLGLPVGLPASLHDLSVTFVPTFLHYHKDGATGVDENGPYDRIDLAAGDPLSGLPLGDWSITIVSFTGQTWTLPNDLALLQQPVQAQGSALSIVP